MTDTTRKNCGSSSPPNRCDDLAAKKTEPTDEERKDAKWAESAEFQRGYEKGKMENLPYRTGWRAGIEQGRKEVMDTCSECSKVQQEIGRKEGIDAVEIAHKEVCMESLRKTGLNEGKEQNEKQYREFLEYDGYFKKAIAAARNKK